MDSAWVERDGCGILEVLGARRKENPVWGPTDLMGIYLDMKIERSGERQTGIYNKERCLTRVWAFDKEAQLYHNPRVDFERVPIFSV